MNFKFSHCFCVALIFHNLPFSCLPIAMLQRGSYLGSRFVVHILMLSLAHIWCVTYSLKFITCLVNVYEDNFVFNIIVLFMTWGTFCYVSSVTYMCPLLCLSYDLQSLDEITDRSLRRKDGSSTCEDFVSLVQTWLSKIQVLGYISIYIFKLCRVDGNWYDWAIWN